MKNIDIKGSSSVIEKGLFVVVKNNKYFSEIGFKIVRGEVVSISNSSFFIECVETNKAEEINFEDGHVEICENFLKEMESDIQKYASSISNRFEFYINDHYQEFILEYRESNNNLNDEIKDLYRQLLNIENETISSKGYDEDNDSRVWFIIGADKAMNTDMIKKLIIDIHEKAIKLGLFLH